MDSGEATMPTFLENPQELPPKLGNAQDLQIAPIPLAPGTPDVVVVPLLSTDSVEGLLQGRSVQEVRDAALAVAATVQNVGGSLSAGALQQHLQSVLGRDYNSVSAISVQHQSVLTVRLGAIQQATSKYGIVPRQQSVSVLVFVSKQKFKNSNHEEFRVTPNNVYAIFNVRHVHALEGTKPTFRPRAENRRREIQVASQYFDPILVRKLDFDLLQDAVRQNDWNNFRAQIKTANDKETKEHKVPSAAAIGSLWLALSGESSPSLSTPMQIRLPILSEEDLRTSIALPQESQTFFLLDDGKSVSGTLRGGSNLQSGSLEAELHADQLVDSSKTAKIDISQKPIISDVAEVSGSGGAVHVSFPSLAAGKWTAENPSVKVNFKVKRYSGLTKPSSTGEEFWEAHGTYPAVIINTKPEPAAPNKPATLTVKDGHVNVAQGKAFVNIKVAAPTNGKQYSITIVSTAGASIGGVGPAGQTALEQSGNQWLIKSDGEVLLEIRGAASGQTFSIQMIDKDGSQITVAPVTVD
ncbi:MAG: hypothetical protein ACREJD_10270 [Phycisphaerales bacterium]